MQSTVYGNHPTIFKNCFQKIIKRLVESDRLVDYRVNRNSKNHNSFVFYRVAYPFIPFDRSLKALSKVFCVRVDPVTRSAVNG